MIKKLKNVKVLITPSVFSENNRTLLECLEKAGCQVIMNPYKRRLNKDELIQLLSSGAAGIIAGLEPLDREVLQKSNLKVISRCGSGLSNVDLEAAKELGIKVCFTPYGPTAAVAELTVGIMISLIRQVFQMNNDLHDGKWIKRTGVQLEGKIVVIIGYGRIGRRVAALLKPFKVKIIAVDPFLLKRSVISSVVNRIEVRNLKQALPKADIVTIHSSGEDQIIGRSEFDLIKPGAFLLNVARGGVIDEQALIQALEDKKIKGAWIDTFNIEPYSGPLIKYPQVVLTPHIGSYSLESRKRMESEAVNNLISAF